MQCLSEKHMFWKQEITQLKQFKDERFNGVEGELNEVRLKIIFAI